ncbi:MAG: hypothetical protein ACR2LG_01520 [Actinomycetota bacterium]
MTSELERTGLRELPREILWLTGAMEIAFSMVDISSPSPMSFTCIS